MLDVRRFFQDDDDTYLPCASSAGGAPSSKPRTDDADTNVHMVDFARPEIARSDARFPQVDEILDRLDNNARAVNGVSRRPD
ncbi:hypothetical protein SLH49_18140 [Cognatiyoonia sp. IB215446]|uniref:hypothetical protein n=1 Tax=Cognatiyoonia sp. IB215446 TaxID=3097355 RepID=UPI002A0DC8D0|nr:hypothetical protein [Cognatiyoonia sp. IB215446]MDX8349912.1 hypothetical protein [Cognatiyoonia sp. IB215446]